MDLDAETPSDLARGKSVLGGAIALFIDKMLSSVMYRGTLEVLSELV